MKEIYLEINGTEYAHIETKQGQLPVVAITFKPLLVSPQEAIYLLAELDASLRLRLSTGAEEALEETTAKGGDVK